MAMTEVTTTNEVTDLFKNLEERKTLLIKCTDLYKTLDSHYTSLLKSLNSKSKKLDSALQYLDSPHQISLDNLNNRENSIPNLFSSLSSEIESKKASAIAELRKPLDLSLRTIEILKSLCRRMDCSRLMKFLIERRKDKKSLKDEMEEAMKECVDPAKMVLEAVKDFIDAKETAKRQVVDKRWACGMVVSGLFSPEKLMEREKGMEAAFAKKTVAEAEKLLREWKEKGEQLRDGDGEGEGEGDGEGESEGKMGSAETAMFFQVVIGFGLKEIFEDDFYVKAGIEFSTRRDMAKLAIPLFGDKLPDFIDKLIKNGKEVEAVYFAVESSLTERFQPAILLKSFLRNCKKNTTELLMKGNHNAEATEEAKRYETNYIRAIVRCVVDYNLESVFPIDNLKKRLSVLEKEKADKKASAANSKPLNKRAHSSGADRSNGAPPRPSKRSKYPSHGRREISQPLSPVSRYMGPYSYSNPTAYNPGAPAVTYAPRFGAPHVAPANQITQQQYVLPSGSTPSELISAYGMHDPIDTVSTAPQVVNYYGGVAADPNAVPQLNNPYVLPDGSAANPSAVAQHGGTYVVPGVNVPASAQAAPESSYGVQNVYRAYDYGATSTSYRPPYAQ